MYQGATVFTRMPSLAHSHARLRVSWFMAPEGSAQRSQAGGQARGHAVHCCSEGVGCGAAERECACSEELAVNEWKARVKFISNTMTAGAICAPVHSKKTIASAVR